MMGDRKKVMKYSTLYFFIYCPLGVMCPLISQYLNSIGFTGTQVGIITSLGTAVAIFAGMFWGEAYANSNKKRWILMSMALASGGLALISTGTKVFIIYAALYGCLYFFQGPLHGLCDSLVIERTESFSFIRAFGAFGYAIAVFAAGEFAEATGLKNIFYIYAIAYVIAALIIMTEQEPPLRKQKEEKIKATVLLHNKKYVKLMISVFFVCGTNVANSTYFGFLFREGGGDVAGIGLAFLLMAGSEAPFMMMVPTLIRKFTSSKLILITMIISALRFAFYATGPSAGMLLSTFFLQGIVNGILLVELVRYISRIVDEKYNSVAIATYYAIANSLSIIICNLLGGGILDHFGPAAVYGFFAIYNVIAVILYVGMGLHKE